ncbi:MAG: hypothetical protein HKO85_09520 [Xanthomonadales bacterium]|nr:hypothetical protein [Gammaproteobacteria bacterium]MBT8057467.1 hypothetical protein [Gammaproteobacteria bacterium]NNJ78046.1 hypothetical protein [Xanthomonadales bacterium]NNL05517.1 hypothetical protein [Xanthomonadales bacterium]
MINVKECQNESVVCPHCEKTLGSIHAVKTKTNLGVRFIYACGFCRKVLGVSHRKGFWMG